MGGHKFLLVLTLVCTAPGCIHMHPTQSGFLADYSQLEPVGKKDRLLVKAVDSAALQNVDSFYIEPVAWLADDMGQPANSNKDQEAIRNALQEALEKELGCLLPIVDEIGPQTAVVRSAVTGVRESMPIMNMILITQIVGPLFNGGASAEIEVIDQQGTQIAAQSVAYRGHDWDIIGFFWKRQHSKSAMRRAAKQLADDLDIAGEEEVEVTSPGLTSQPQSPTHPAQESFRLIR